MNLRVPINGVEVKIEKRSVTLRLEAKPDSICTLRHNGKLITDQWTTFFEILLFKQHKTQIWNFSTFPEEVNCVVQLV